MADCICTHCRVDDILGVARWHSTCTSYLLVEVAVDEDGLRGPGTRSGVQDAAKAKAVEGRVGVNCQAKDYCRTPTSPVAWWREVICADQGDCGAQSRDCCLLSQQRCRDRTVRRCATPCPSANIVDQPSSHCASFSRDWATLLPPTTPLPPTKITTISTTQYRRLVTHSLVRPVDDVHTHHDVGHHRLAQDTHPWL